MKQSAYDSIQEKRLQPWKGEEEVRFAWNKALEDATGLHLFAERDRNDASYNHVIIEYKAPGYFKGKKDSSAFHNAINERLLPYIIKKSGETKIPESDFIGIAIDGEHICFAQVIDGIIHSQHLMPFSPESVEMVVDALRSDTRKGLTTENLLADFGHGSANARAFMQQLSDGLSQQLAISGNNKIKMLFEEWRTLYGQVADLSILQAESISKELNFIWSGAASESISARLFVLHTYNSLLIKLLAAEIVSAHGLTSTSQPAQSMAALKNDSQMLEFLSSDIERSAIFQDAGINGFVEEAIFSWYLDVASLNTLPELLPTLRRLLSILSLYRLDHLSQTRDVLRDLYQGLVPGKLRQSLGEFYTPDWLVDFTLNKVSSPDIMNQRVLDPTCGSGAFLLAVIRKKRQIAKSKKLSAKETLNLLCESVWGFDLNPLAVQTARVNFLIEVADLLTECPGHEFEVPVLMADAIYSPAPSPQSSEPIIQYRIGSQFAKLDIHLPLELALDRVSLDVMFNRMGKDVEVGLDFDESMNKARKGGFFNEKLLKEWDAPLRYTYDQILNLHHQNWNGIWFRIVRNFFWSATAGQFDLVIGNPPWVRWSKLPDLYRERVKPTCEQYGIFSKTRMHGGNELDISAMITYTVADKWLSVGGQLAFVITGTLFKNPSSAGFRTFKLEPLRDESFYLEPVSVDDMKALKPFEDASNHTTIAVFRKSENEPTYPVSYRVWGPNLGEKRVVKTSKSLDSVLETIRYDEKEAFPVSESGSPWAILDPGRFETIKYLSRQCSWTKGRKGITTDLNGVFFVPILNVNDTSVLIRSRPEAGKKDIGPVKQAWVEPEDLYPLIKGAGDFEECYLKINAPDFNNEDRLFTFVPNVGISNTDYAKAEERIENYSLKKTAAWFDSFESILRERSTYRRQMKGAPFHAIYNVGEYTFKPWKVIWPEMSSSFYAAVAGSSDVPIMGIRPYVPDHKIYFSAFDDKATAFYLCGLLNSKTVQEWINAHNVSIQVADVFKHLDLPEFDSKDCNHIFLAEKVMAAHEEHDKEKRKLLLNEINVSSESILTKWSGELRG
ncbi:Eco57I restriction-modification methylase domain-containing protein [Pantoea sp. SOD02]|uniref:Eco57I restriction-modification methylase domain-containing protein n=1 Tax=Pantoea sp. SOD02 TaxID=2970818 RepID=UPI0021577670|nr:N-6 DNA methylase [Pantoea sp. SOD02]UVC30404.1 N-6 DNA methylase [Pantoea sp. SOD02]